MPLVQAGGGQTIDAGGLKLPKGAGDQGREAGAIKGDLLGRKQLEFAGQLALQGSEGRLGLQRGDQLQLQPFRQPFAAEGQGLAKMDAGQGVEAPRVADGDLAAAQGPLQQAQGVEVADQGQGAGFTELEAQPLDPLTGGRLLGQTGGDGRRRDGDVVAQVWTTDAAVAASLKGAVRHGGRLQGAAEVFGQPALAQARIDVIPGQGLVTEAIQVGGVHGLGGLPVAHLQGAITALQPCGDDGAAPGGMAAFGRFKPGIEPRPGPPGRFDDGGQAPVAPADEILHGREAPIGVVGFEALKGPQGLAQQLLAPLEFSAADAVPLEGGMGFGGEIADGEV